MRSLKNVIDLILFGNIWVALGAVCLVQSSVHQLDSKEPLVAYSIMVFFSTLFLYNFQRIFYKPQKNVSLHSVRRKWIFENQRTIKILAGIGAGGILVTLFFNEFRTILYLSPLLLLSLAYFAPAIKLRRSPWFKLLTLTFVWTVVTALVPSLLTFEEPFSFAGSLHLVVRFVFMVAICIPFDIRDLAIDKADDISTLPHVMGEKNTRVLAFLLMLIYILLIMTEYLGGMFGMRVFAGLLVSAVINTIFVAMTRSYRSEYFYVAGLDGTMIFQGLLLIISEWMLK